MEGEEERSSSARNPSSSSSPPSAGTGPQSANPRGNASRRRANTSPQLQQRVASNWHPPLPGVQELLLQDSNRALIYRRVSRIGRSDSEGEHGLGRRAERSSSALGRTSSQGSRSSVLPLPSPSPSQPWIHPAWLSSSSSSSRQGSSSLHQRRRLSLPQAPSIGSPRSSRRPQLTGQSSSWSNPTDSREARSDSLGITTSSTTRSSPREILRYLSGESLQSDVSDDASSTGGPVGVRESQASNVTALNLISGSVGHFVEDQSRRRSKRLGSEPRAEGLVEPSLERDLLMDPSAEPRTYQLIIRQAPLNGRAAGSGAKDRRPLDPLPIIQLKILDKDGAFDPDDLSHTSPYLILRASLKSSKENSARDLVTNPEEDDQQLTRTLDGKNFASAHVCRDLDGSRACFFIFSDLNVKVEGEYVLCFSLIRLGRLKTSAPNSNETSNPAGQVVAEILSEPFTVYSTRRYPGMAESSALAKHLAAQNINIPVRNDVRRGRE